MKPNLFQRVLYNLLNLYARDTNQYIAGKNGFTVIKTQNFFFKQF